MNKPEISKEMADKIANRQSWLRIGLVAAVVGTACFKLIGSPLNIDLSGFDFSDLLSLFLAMFSIALAVAFYYKATDTSNRFYDNSYRFTREVSEILGRIEAGFGERLKHLDEGYVGLKDRFDRLPFDSQKAKEEIESEEQELRKVEEEKNELLEQLATRAQLEKEEKDTLFAALSKKDEELARTASELRFLKRRLARAESQPQLFPDEDIPSGIGRYVRSEIVDELGVEFVLEAPKSLVQRRFEEIRPKLHEAFINNGKKFGWFDEEGLLTMSGVNYFRQQAMQMANKIR